MLGGTTAIDTNPARARPSTDGPPGIPEIDEQAQLAQVDVTVTWLDLIERLRRQRLMPRVYPGAQESTVGAFVAAQGVGIGSFQYGSLDDWLASVRMATRRGHSLEFSGSSLELSAQAHGRSGVMTDVVLRLQPLASMEPTVAVFEGPSDLELCLAEISRLTLPLWSVSIADRAAMTLRTSAEQASFELPQGRYGLLFSSRREDRPQLLPRLRGAVLGAGGRLLPTQEGHDVWLQRFASSAAAGSTLTPIEFRVQLSQLTAMIYALPAALRRRLAIEGVVVGAARFLAVRFFLTDRSSTPDESAAVARVLGQLAKLHGAEARPELGFHGGVSRPL